MPQVIRAEGSAAVTSPMPGLLKAIHVAAGDEVKAGQALCVIEAMKMETVLRAERDATVEAVCAEAGDRLAIDAVIMRFA
jgi:propionyl-CoA carboxylase alpha chain